MTDSALQNAILALIERLSNGDRDPSARDALLRESLQVQRHRVPAYANLCQHRQVADSAPLSGLPALPTDVFRYARVAAHPPQDDMRLFRTSGTTSGARGAHPIADLTLYDAAAQAAARHALFDARRPMRVLVLAPSAQEAPDSSLSHMLARFVEWFGDGQGDTVWSGNQVDVDALRATATRAQQDGVPVALVGTSFAYVLAEDALTEQQAPPIALPEGSFVMQTGGFKGRSRTVDEADMVAMLQARYGVPGHRVVQEYGMTELCSQMYQLGVRDPNADGRFWVPGWVRVTAVDPHTLEALPAGELGLLRIDDLANLGSVSSVQTSDLARATEGYVELHGRAPGAVPRGCSLATEEALASKGAKP